MITPILMMISTVILVMMTVKAMNRQAKMKMKPIPVKAKAKKNPTH